MVPLEFPLQTTRNASNPSTVVRIVVGVLVVVLK